jgi:hypothetical protein
LPLIDLNWRRRDAPHEIAVGWIFAQHAAEFARRAFLHPANSRIFPPV